MEAVKRVLRKFIPLSDIRRWVLRTKKWISAYRSEFATFYPVGHFYSPIPDLAEIECRGDQIFGLERRDCPGVELNEAAQLQLLSELAPHVDDWKFPSEPDGSHRYYTNNQVFPCFDAAILHAMLRHLEPKRLIEVGSGFSSAMMLDTAERHLATKPQFTFIEPHPDRLHSLLTEQDLETATILELTIQEADLGDFEGLEAGDLFFVDSSHVLKIGSDVNYILFEVLPRLRPGVFIHFHDIRWPFEYPREWIELGRAWNEAYGLRAFLQYNDSFEIVFFNAFMEQHHRDLIEQVLPFAADTPGGSIWIRKLR